jgi:hypothetical protein
VLKINWVATSPHHKAVLAYSYIEGLFEDVPLPHCQLGYREALMEETSLRKIKVPAKLAASLSNSSDTFILVPAKNVLAQEEQEGGEEGRGEEGGKKVACLQRDWKEMVEYLEAKIESSFPYKRWIHAKNLLRELLWCPDLCISADYKLCFIKDHKRKKVPLNMFIFLLLIF